VPTERLARRLAETRHDVEDALGDAGLDGQLGHADRRQRCQLGGLDDHGVAGRERRRGLPGGHEDREIPGHDGADDADRLADDQAQRVRPGRRDRVEDLVDCLGEPAIGFDGLGDVDLAAVGDRLTGLEGVELGELLEVVLEELGEAEEELLALDRGAVRPAAVVECSPGRPDCRVDVGGVTSRDVRERLASCRILGDERLAGGRVAELTVDECLRPERRQCRDGHRAPPLVPLILREAEYRASR
jgi:hypothetical protein